MSDNSIMTEITVFSDAEWRSHSDRPALAQHLTRVANDSFGYTSESGVRPFDDQLIDDLMARGQGDHEAGFQTRLIIAGPLACPCGFLLLQDVRVGGVAVVYVSMVAVARTNWGQSLSTRMHTAGLKFFPDWQVLIGRTQNALLLHQMRKLFVGRELLPIDRSPMAGEQAVMMAFVNLVLPPHAPNQYLNPETFIYHGTYKIYRHGPNMAQFLPLPVPGSPVAEIEHRLTNLGMRREQGDTVMYWVG